MGFDLDRRAFLAGAAAAAAAPCAARADFGLSAGPDLIGAVASLAGVTEGRGAGTLHVMFAPWCHVSPALWRDSRNVTGRLRIRWIPFSGGQPEGREPTERLLASGDPSMVQATFVRLAQRGGAPVPTPLCDAQDAALASYVAPLVIRDSGRGMNTPTLVYTLAGNRVRLVPGGIGSDGFEAIARLAA